MKARFTLILLLASAVAGAQNLSSAEALIEAEGPLTGGDHELHVKVYNHTGSGLMLQWHRSTNDMPGTWTSAICDWYLCQDTPVSNYFVPVAMGDSALIICHIYDDGATEGTGTVYLELYDGSDSANTNVAMTFRYTSWPLGVETRESALDIYPNPAGSILTVAHGSNARLINIYSITGQLLRTYDATNVDATVLTVHDLPAGQFLVEVVRQYGASHRALVTKN
jgi:hypothetical protein